MRSRHNCVSAGLWTGMPRCGFRRHGASRRSANGGGDDRRQGNLLPRQGLLLCVAPYFADRGVGDMRGWRRCTEKMPPRRWWQTVIAQHKPQDTQHITYHISADATAPHPSGVRFGGCPPVVPACRHDPAWRNTGLRTAATTSGVAEMSASGHRLRRGRMLRSARLGGFRRHSRCDPAAATNRAH